ncbi:hypothetical protein [Nocardia sp. NPDC004711]
MATTVAQQLTTWWARPDRCLCPIRVADIMTIVRAPIPAQSAKELNAAAETGTGVVSLQPIPR